MVGSLLALLDLLQLHVCLVRRVGDRLGKEVARHEVAAAARGQVAPAREQAHGLIVDLAVALCGVLDGAAALCEGRRVEDDEVEGAALLAQARAVLTQLRQIFEDVRAGEVHAIVEPIQTRVLGSEVDGGLAHVDAAHEVRPARRGVQAEGAHVAEAVKHAAPAGDLPNGPAVVLLVEEEARLLAVLDVKVKDKAVLDDLDAGAFGNLRGLDVPPALVLRQALLRAGRRVVALVDAAHVLAVGLERLEQQGIDRGSEELHAHRAHLRDQHVLIAVDDEAGHPVGLREDHAAGVGVGLAAGKGASAHGYLAVFPCPGDPAGPEGFVDAVVGVSRDDTHADL